MHGDNKFQAKKRIHFDRIRSPKFGTGLDEQYLWRGVDKVQFGVSRKEYPSSKNKKIGNSYNQINLIIFVVSACCSSWW